MAIWQVHFRLIRLNTVLEYTNETFLQSLKILEKTFPEEVSWCEFYKQYGNIESTVIEFDFSEVVINNISLRIDLRFITKQQLQAIYDFSLINELAMEYNNTIYDVTIENFVKLFRMSRAKKFVENPYAFLEHLEENQS